MSPDDPKKPLAKRFSLLWIADIPNVKDRRKVEVESHHLLEDMKNHIQSGLRIGDRLLTLRNLVKAERTWIRFLEDFSFSHATAYRYMKTATVVRAQLTEAAYVRVRMYGLKIAGATEEQPFGKYSRTIKLLPPPKSEDPEVLDRWLEQIEKTEKMEKRYSKVLVVLENPDKAMELAYKAVRRFMNKLLEDTRPDWAIGVCTLVLAEARLKDPMMITPKEPPAAWRKPVGRPPRKRTVPKKGAKHRS